MASLTTVQIELANSLTQEELPTKLRCAICSKLAVNAFRLPCCETAICESCQSTLPSSCPVCEHSPVSGADCTVYKSLRTTIRVFLKTEEKKREASRPKTTTPNPAPATPTDLAPTPVNAAPLSEVPPVDAAAAAPIKEEAGLGQNEIHGQTSALTGEDAVEAPASLEQDGSSYQDQEIDVKEQTTDQDNNHDQVPEDGANDQADLEGQPTEETDEAVEAGHEEAESGDADMEADQDNANESSEGVNNFGDMNQMQMMMAMQNGMNPAAFGSFPMMGMGMGMDPMAMQQMFMNGGFGAQGMGMNGMNMNMGMNGFSGGNNDWNGQQSWNVGQDNFNPNAAGMGNGDFGNFNSGFRNGYNSGNFGHNQYNDFGRGGYGFRGRGRGRGFYNRGFGRGYHNQGFNPRHFGQDMWAQQNSQENSGMGPNANGNNSAMESQNASNTDEFGRTVRPDSEPLGHAVELTGVDYQGDVQNGDNGATEGGASDNIMQNGDLSSTDPYPRSRSQGTGSLPPTVAPDVPLNAPTGPKAMRQGLPNTSALHLRARGFMTDQQSPISGPNGSVVQSPMEDVPPSRSSSRHEKESSHRHPEREGRDQDHNEDKSRDYEGDRPRSRSRSRSRDRKESRRHRRHRSESATGDEREGDHRRRKHKSSRRPTRDDDDGHKSRSKDEKHDRSRSVSPERERERGERDQKRSSHRSHRDRDRDRGERESDFDRHDRHKKSSHRSRHDHGERERSRDRGDRDRDRERDKDRKERHRDRDRDRERDREHRHRSRKTSAEPPTPVEGAERDSFNPPSGPRSGMSIKGTGSKAESKSGSGSKSSRSHIRESESSSRRPSKASASGGGSKGAAAAAASASSSSGKDPHTLEREARDRERLLKEAQRMAGLAGLASLKRNRDVTDDRVGGRRKSRRSEAVYDDEEERMRRLEAEREGGRWD
ncbi:hypothetical protein PG990_006402 [Apiospora arundinis]|uniref:Pre-mRNA-splicing factor 38B n=1 Tax=Apiospora arundinis TaxID=335852 RepID=A0ABR2JAP1_9PEZI